MPGSGGIISISAIVFPGMPGLILEFPEREPVVQIYRHSECGLRLLSLQGGRTGCRNSYGLLGYNVVFRGALRHLFAHSCRIGRRGSACNPASLRIAGQEPV